jgi:hypothetical protein
MTVLSLGQYYKFTNYDRSKGQDRKLRPELGVLESEEYLMIIIYNHKTFIVQATGLTFTSQILDYGRKACLGANTLAYFYEPSVTKMKML